jgi:hypothetical protein
LAHEYHEWLHDDAYFPPDRTFVPLLIQEPALAAKLSRFENYRRILSTRVPGPESVCYEVFNQRWLARLPTAITCNCHPCELERWLGGAALSRLMHGLLPLEMNGPDHRLLAR